MTVFEVLETIEALWFEESFADGKSLSASNVIIFPPEDDGMNTDEDDRNGVNCITDNICGRQLLSAAELDLLGTGSTHQIIDESQALGSSKGKVQFYSYILISGPTDSRVQSII